MEQELKQQLTYLQQVSRSPELQQVEYELCVKDVVYWLMNWVYTLDQHDKEFPIKSFPNKKYIKLIAEVWLKEQLLLIPKSRQMMLSWLIVALYLWDTQFHAGRLNFFQSKKEEDADSLIRRAKFMYDKQPSFLKKYKVNPSNQSKDIYCKLEFPEISSMIRGIPQGGDQIRMHTASGIFCLGFNTKILTSDLKWIKISDVTKNQLLAGFDENIGDSGYKKNGQAVARHWKITSVVNIKNLKRPCYKLKFSDGTEIICSKEHKWLAGFGQKWVWIETEKLKVKTGQGYGSKIVKFFDIWSVDNSFDFNNFGIAKASGAVELIEKKFIGEKEVIGLTTSTGTFVAEGLGSHNSDEMAFQNEAEAAYTAAKPTIDGGGKFTGVSSAEPGFFADMVDDTVEMD